MKSTPTISNKHRPDNARLPPESGHIMKPAHHIGETFEYYHVREFGLGNGPDLIRA